jgi:hypothetical protein
VVILVAVPMPNDCCKIIDNGSVLIRRKMLWRESPLSSCWVTSAIVTSVVTHKFCNILFFGNRVERGFQKTKYIFRCTGSVPGVVLWAWGRSVDESNSVLMSAGAESLYQCL